MGVMSLLTSKLDYIQKNSKEFQKKSQMYFKIKVKP
jgi:hypothetical protein